LWFDRPCQQQKDTRNRRNNSNIRDACYITDAGNCWENATIKRAVSISQNTIISEMQRCHLQQVCRQLKYDGSKDDDAKVITLATKTGSSMKSTYANSNGRFDRVFRFRSNRTIKDFSISNRMQATARIVIFFFVGYYSMGRTTASEAEEVLHKSLVNLGQTSKGRFGNFKKRKDRKLMLYFLPYWDQLSMHLYIYYTYKL
jgi:hypothetical protein